MSTVRIVELDSDDEEVLPVTSLRRLCAECQTAIAPWSHACQKGHSYCVLALIDAKHAPPDADDEGRTPLHIAAQHGHDHIINGLMSLTSLRLDARTIYGETVAHVCVKHERLPCLKCVLGKPPLPLATSVAVMRDSNGDTVLHMAVRRNDNEAALYLLRRFGRCIAMTTNRESALPLHIATTNGNIEFVRIATNYGRSMCDVRDGRGATPVYNAARYGHLTCLRYMIDKCRADLNILTTEGHNVVHAAAIGGDIRVLLLLLQRLPNALYAVSGDERRNAFQLAAAHGHADMLQSLSRMVDREYLRGLTDEKGNSLLHLAVARPSLSTSAFLLALRCSPTAVNSARMTPLQLAHDCDNAKLLSLLERAATAEEATKPVTGMDKVRRMMQRRGRRRTVAVTADDVRRTPRRTLSPDHSAAPTSGYGSSADLHDGALLPSPRSDVVEEERQSPTTHTVGENSKRVYTNHNKVYTNKA